MDQSLTLQHSTVSRNTADVVGGGIYDFYGVVTDNLISGNTARVGGAGAFIRGSHLSRNTVTGNQVQDHDGHPLGAGGGVLGYGFGFLAFNTITANTASIGGGVGIQAAGYVGVFEDTGDLVARNVGGNCSRKLSPESVAGLEDDSARSCGFDTVTSDAKVDTFTVPQGGPTETLPLAPDSPAVGLVPADVCQEFGDVDQRGFPRRSAARGSCDAGAYDTGGDAPQITSAASASVRSGDVLAFSVTSTGFPAATYSLEGAPSWISIAPSTGELTGNVPTDAYGVHTFSVLARNSSGADAKQSFTLTVNGGPAFTSDDHASAVAGQVFSFAVSAAAYPEVTSYSLTDAPGWLSVDQTTGLLSGTPPVGTTGTSSFVVRGSNGGVAAAQTFTLTVSAPAGAAVPDAPTIGRALPGNGSASVAFTAPVSDGGAPVSGYTVTSSPGGLTATGTGSPITVSGLRNGTAYAFTVTATNAAGTSFPSSASNSVTPLAPLTITTPGVLRSGTVGAPYAGRLTATGGSAPYTWTLAAGSALPNGLAINPNGTLTGTPTVAGTRSVSVRVRDAASPTQRDQGAHPHRKAGPATT